MAWLKEHICDDCGKPATCELLTRVNGVWGRYCKRCGKRELKRLQEREAES